MINQTRDIWRTVRKYDANIPVFVDLKNLQGQEKSQFLDALSAVGANLGRLTFLNNH
jgi:hypothetical protein